MKVQLYIDPACQLSKVPYLVPNNIHYVTYQDFLDAQNQPDALTAYLYAAELAKGEIKRLKAEVERLTADLNKMTKTPEGVDYVEVDVGFWTKSGSRLPSSYSTFWSNDKGVQS
jgi:hypothetical protein